MSGTCKRGRIVASALAAALVVVPSASAAPGRVRVGGAPRRPASSTELGALATSTPMHVTVALAPRDPAALAGYATAVSTPGSSAYRHYLTVAEFRARFAPTPARTAAVAASLDSHGLRAGTVSANGLGIPLTATAGQLDRAFSLSLERVRLTGGRTAFANTRAPLFDAPLARLIEGVVGLDDLSRAAPLDRTSAGPIPPSIGGGDRVARPHVVTGGPRPCPTAVANASGSAAYTADQIASAYQFSSLYGAGDEGTGQTIAIFEAEPYAESDIDAYESCYGTKTQVGEVPVDGGAGTGYGSGEAALDIEDVIGLAPLAQVVVYDGPDTITGIYDTYSAIVSADRAKMISTSWGLCEPAVGSSQTQLEDTLFQEAAAQGQSVFAPAGDSGSEDCDGAGVGLDTTLEVDDPGSQPYVTSVGGTSMSSSGPPPAQSVWNDMCSGGPCGGGGGISGMWTMPSYQSGAPSLLNVIGAHSSSDPCGAPAGSHCREIPDVSADADPTTGYEVYYDGAWTKLGGTSAAAPVWAAFTALANASSACAGNGIGFANPALYDAAASGYAGDFDDITSGENDITATNAGMFPAGPGYDMASGLGTPNGSALAAMLCAAATRIAR